MQAFKQLYSLTFSSGSVLGRNLVASPRFLPSSSSRTSLLGSSFLSTSLYRSFAAAKPKSSSKASASKSKPAAKKIPASKSAAKPATKTVAKSVPKSVPKPVAKSVAQVVKVKVAKKPVAARKAADPKKAELIKQKNKEAATKLREREKAAKDKEKEREARRRSREKELADKEKARLAKEKEREKKENAPRRSLSAYTLWTKSQLSSIKRDPSVPFSQQFKAQVAKWKKLSDAEKKPYVLEAAKDRARYEREKAEVAKSAPPKRPLTAFLQFSKQVRPRVQKENPKLKLTELSVKIGQEWNQLSDAEKEKYIKASRKSMEEYAKKYPKLE